MLEFNQFFPLGEIIYFYMISFEKNKKKVKKLWDGNLKQNDVTSAETTSRAFFLSV